MKITLGKLKALIKEAFRTRTVYIPTGEDIAAAKSDINYGAKPEEWRQASDEMFDEEVKEMSELPEFKSIDEFVQTKFDNDEFEFTATELNALVLGIYFSTKTGVSLKSIKQQLIDLGFKFIPREPVKHARGFGAPMHGSDRYAGNAAGSGMGFGPGGAVGFGMGGGKGAMGGGYDWKASDARNLSMGSKRR